MSSARFPLRPVALATALALQALVARHRRTACRQPKRRGTLPTRDGRSQRRRLGRGPDEALRGRPGGARRARRHPGQPGHTWIRPSASTSYTNELIQNQQARSVGDVLLNDPSVRVARGFGNFQELVLHPRLPAGFRRVAYNGLYSLLPRQYISSEFFERVEVLRGANALPERRRAGRRRHRRLDQPAAQARRQRAADAAHAGRARPAAQFYAAADIARRFGPDQSTGIRVNAARRDGGTGVDNEKREARRGLASASTGAAATRGSRPTSATRTTA